MTATVTLHQLDSELTNLLDYRQERIEDRESPASAEELEAIDGAIAAYMAQLPRKVDGVAAILRYFDEQVEFADREIKRLRERKRQVEENAQRLKDCAAVVLERQPMPAKGCRKLVGTHSTLMLKGNGGVAPLAPLRPELIPDELCEWHGKMSWQAWSDLREFLRDRESLLYHLGLQFTRVPSNSLIREALAQPCATCDGTGCTERGFQDCTACAGTGKNAVPGASLEPRGQHVEVK